MIDCQDRPEQGPIGYADLEHFFSEAHKIMRAIFVITIINTEYNCILDRAMRFLVSQFVAALRVRRGHAPEFG